MKEFNEILICSWIYLLKHLHLQYWYTLFMIVIVVLTHAKKKHQNVKGTMRLSFPLSATC